MAQARRYRDVFELAPVCACDTALSPEERQTFRLLGQLRLDRSPDAHACRLKIHLATAAARASMPTNTMWSAAAELAAYVQASPVYRTLAVPSKSMYKPTVVTVPSTVLSVYSLYSPIHTRP